ncbi:hypothetical protein COMA1_10382 [Candidatus Nitrospira nitrosa]|uniref:Uncharacterized protein n=1 Tax=Candidatus Nitrospira nitrosa TaxID=1742972 RepID=A0A0S4L818_9BACT|nr:hypothetical protein COMA1_10382 [Candidatus Nitrospira nitrosa]
MCVLLPSHHLFVCETLDPVLRYRVKESIALMHIPSRVNVLLF